MAKFDEFGEKIKSIDIKKVVKTLTLLFGIVLIIFISFFDAKFDFTNIDWERWIARSTVLVGIMIFGILMGNSTGSDIQKEKIGGLFQNKCLEYNEMREFVKSIEDFFSSWWLFFKERKLIEKKVDYLIDMQIEMRVAKLYVKHLEKDDFVVGKMIFDETKPHEKIYQKELDSGEKVLFKKVKQDVADKIINIYSFYLDTFGESYYLSLYDYGDLKTNDAEIGKKLAKKIAKDKRQALALKIVSSLVISIAWSALTIYDFTSGGESAIKQAWLNLFSRITALVTSYISGFSTSVVNVRDQARAIENKTKILSNFRNDIEHKRFIPETYEQELEREYKEQLETNVELEKENV